MDHDSLLWKKILLLDMIARVLQVETTQGKVEEMQKVEETKLSGGLSLVNKM